MSHRRKGRCSIRGRVSIAWLLLGAVAPAGDAFAAGPVSRWSAEGSANDGTGANPGVLTNGASFAPGKVGQAFRLDGSNDHVLVQNSSTLDFKAGDFTIQAWVQTKHRGGAGNVFVVSKTSQGHDIQYALGYNAKTAGDGGAMFVVGLKSGTSYVAASHVSIADGRWHLLDGVRQGTSLLLYVDGDLLDCVPLPDGLSLTGANNVVIGGRQNPGNDPYFNGLIDEAAIFDRALGPCEIRQTFAEGGK